MEPASADKRELTRRDYLTVGSGVAVSSFLAGCTGGSSSTSTDTEPGTATDSAQETATQSPATQSTSESYSVTMEPMGAVEFQSVPDTWMVYFSNYGDMGIALGQLDGLQGLIFTENWPMAFYDALPDVDVSFESIPQLLGEDGLDKEVFYELDSDVHLLDPNFIQRLADGWTEADFTEIETKIGPIIGNTIRRRTGEWHDYRYYSLWDAFEKIAEVFQERARYDALKTEYDTLMSKIRADLPPVDERPTVGLVSVNSDFESGSFYAYPVHDGNGHKQYRDLRMQGAFDEHIDGSYAEWDYEQLLSVDPDALVFQYGFSHVSTAEFEERMATMQSDTLGQKLSAVQNGRLYRGGTSYQGPISNMFQTAVAAKQFYPDRFGEWNGIETLSNETERLFDYQQVADVINGEF